MNPFELFKNAGALKEQLGNVQNQLEEITATGSSGGRMVEVTLNGKFEMLDIKLDPICVDNRDVKMLEDLIKAAQHDAISKIQEKIKEISGPMLSSLNIPGM
ncbi:MAG: YbaB/EbfC family nucleoid-associated protein [Treponema sp.]|nr:YbaB/EbfC family nucleoid-associated protein [Treponema sp.]